MKKFVSIYKLRKRIILSVLAFSYVTVLLLFGLIYWSIANNSRGDFFVFQRDVNMTTKIDAFKKNLNIKIKSRELKSTVEDLINSDEYKRPFANLEIVDDSGSSIKVFSFDKPLGKLWANYYSTLLKDKGVTHISVEDMGEDRVNSKFSSCKLKICFYTVNENEIYKSFKCYKKSQANQLSKVDTKYMWVNDYTMLKSKFFKEEYYYYPLSFYFSKLVENSISFLDNSPLVLKSVVCGNFKYPIENFIYFSAVTITTLGYGDILPNSIIVRFMVIMETILGIIIVGTFTSCLFWNRN
ncbi:potassium channel family protein [Clostridium ljungdahlii]|uniref:Voltage-gated potassium channel n=1 Tax=Clostridium ljungdahlii TaxID=1538 RepID=A0A168LA32_9CLOT|nr:potassium channel family protein [Clostridium ljungdahlii]OAA82871.1 voltage-gated potassium channel [Clostridium ljungdahlii]